MRVYNMAKVFTSRQAKIISSLQNSDSPISSKQLGLLLDVSEKTIRNEVKQINSELKTTVIISTSRGFTINKSSSSILGIENLQSRNPDENNVNRLIFYLVKSKEPLNFYDLANDLYISESTLDRTLNSARGLIAEYHLTIERKRNEVILQGSEWNKRRLIQSLILTDTNPTFINEQNSISFLPDVNLSLVNGIISEILENHHYSVNDIYLMNLSVNISIIVNRLINDFSNFEFHIDNVSFMNSEAYQIANEIYIEIRKHYKVNLTSDDINYIACLIISQTKPIQLHTLAETENLLIDDDYAEQVRKILNDVLAYYMLDIDIDKIYNAFLFHISAMVERIRTDTTIVNVCIDSLKYNCPFIYDVAVEIASRLEDLYKIEICDDEIGFIAVHIGYAIEEYQESTNKIRIYLYGPFYKDGVQKITDSLRNKFSNQIILTSSLNSYDAAMYKNSDLIISTFDYGLLPTRSIKISPIITSSDIDYINQSILIIRKKKVKERFTNLVTKYIRPDLFFGTNNYDNEFEAISFLCDELNKQTCQDTNFKEKIITREHISSTCINNQLAIPHAFNETSSHSAICVLISEKPISWFGSHVFMVLLLSFCKKDMPDFMHVYDALVNKLIDQTIANKIMHSKSYDEFIKLIAE